MNQNLKVMVVNGYGHIIGYQTGSRKITNHRPANYRNTGMALMGILKKGQTLTQWTEMHG